MLKLLLVLLAGFLLSTPSQAAMSPLGLSIAPPIEFPPSDFTVAGARINVLWGNHRNVYGFDIGAIGNVTQQEFIGIGIAGGFNWTNGWTRIIGLQVAGGANINTNKLNVVGFQVAGLFNSNQAETTIIGFQIAPLANYSPHTSLYGMQVGIFNKANVVHGFQIGLWNYAEELHGLQIGLINFNKKGMFMVAPILNAGF